MRAEILTIGNEILNGSRVDTNAAFLARKLDAIGIEVRYRSSAGDDMDMLEEAMILALRRADIVIATGGLGPTDDDITKKAICKVFKRNLIFHEDILEDLKKRFAVREIKMPAINQNQALLPQGARFLANRIGSALGIIIEERNRFFCAMPGVPREMETMTEEELLPLLMEKLGREVIVRHMIRTTGIIESELAEIVGPLYRTKEGVSLAYLPSTRGVDLQIKGTGTVREEVVANVAAMAEAIREKVEDDIYTEDDRELEEVIADLLVEQGKTLATAESCTGGLLGGRITRIPGSSRYFLGGVVAYDNRIKINQLGVPAETLEKFGAVSSETARSMARGVREKFEADIGVSITGVAGPTGGSEEKSVGTVFIGVAADYFESAFKSNLGTDRDMIRNRACTAALDMVRRLLLGKL